MFEDEYLPGDTISLLTSWDKVKHIPDIWKSYLLSKFNVKGKIIVWQIGFDGSKLIYYSGRGDGKKVFHELEIPEGKVKRTVKQQAYLEARTRYLDKLKENYKTNLERTSEIINKPMLAYTYAVPGSTGGAGTRTDVYKFPVLAEPKLDGIRCLAKMLDGKVDLRSRTNRAFPFFDHIRKELKSMFEQLPPGCILDGEFYNHDWTFQKITSVVRTSKNEHKDAVHLKYYIFDVITPEELSTSQRKDLLEDVFDDKSDALVRVFGHEVWDHDDIMIYLDACITEGYEGCILRQLCFSGDDDKTWELSLYRGARSKGLLKVKKFIDEEVEIIGGREGKGKYKGVVIFRVRTLEPPYVEFDVNHKGSLEEKTRLFKDLDNLIGKKYTITYQELSTKGVPRFPIGKVIRDYE